MEIEQPGIENDFLAETTKKELLTDLFDNKKKINEALERLKKDFRIFYDDKPNEKNFKKDVLNDLEEVEKQAEGLVLALKNMRVKIIENIKTT